MKTNEKEGAPLQPEPPNDDKPTENNPGIPVKQVSVKPAKISQRVIDDLNARHDRIIASVADIAQQIVELGEALLRVKKKLGHGQWEPFVDNNLRYTIRTAQRYMNASKRRDDILLLGAAGFMATVWGHKQLEEGQKNDAKTKNDASVAFGEDDEDEDDDEGDKSQSGGLPGWKPKNEPVPSTLFSNKGKPGFSYFKEFVSTLDREFFQSQEITAETKLVFIEDAINWLQTQRLNLGEKLKKASS